MDSNYNTCLLLREFIVFVDDSYLKRAAPQGEKVRATKYNLSDITLQNIENLDK